MRYNPSHIFIYYRVACLLYVHSLVGPYGAGKGLREGGMVKNEIKMK